MTVKKFTRILSAAICSPRALQRAAALAFGCSFGHHPLQLGWQPAFVNASGAGWFLHPDPPELCSLRVGAMPRPDFVHGYAVFGSGPCPARILSCTQTYTTGVQLNEAPVLAARRSHRSRPSCCRCPRCSTCHNLPDRAMDGIHHSYKKDAGQIIMIKSKHTYHIII